MTIHEAELEHPRKAFGWAARDPSDVLSPFNFSRRKRERRKVLFCVICHSDLHMIRNYLGTSTYPLVPGHEIVGVVTEIGSKVEKFKVGDRVGMGGMAGSCRSCQESPDHLEIHCSKLIFTYSVKNVDGTTTYGGFSDFMAADSHFVFHIPDSLSLHATAPLFCAGITVYSPLRYFGLDKSDLNIGVIGLLGLGHMAVKFVKAFGARVTVISTSPNRKEEAIEHLGVNSSFISHEQAENGTLDGIIDTVPVVHPLLPLLNLLKTRGKLVILGAPKEPLEPPVIPLISGKKSICGSVVGGMKETEELLEFAAKHKIEADVEVIPMSYVNTEMERLLKANVRYGFVIDIVNTLKP